MFTFVVAWCVYIINLILTVDMIGGQDKLIRIWDLKTGALINSIGPFSQPVRTIVYSEHAMMKQPLEHAERKEKICISPSIWFTDWPDIKSYTLP